MLEQIKKVLVESANVDADKITLEANLKEDLAIDSLDAVELVLDLESAFDIKIEDDEIAALVTVGDIVKLVESKK
ncbi:MAG: acyl carrier protein [Acholeplasmatales bacterium]|nr:acyl carrier protein [Acholeplasmatales bacterium]